MHKHTSKNACTHTHTNGPTNVIYLFHLVLFCCILFYFFASVSYPVFFILSSVILSCIFVIFLLSCIFSSCHLSSYPISLSHISYPIHFSSVIRSYFYVTHTLSYIFLILSSFCYRIVFLCHIYPIIKVSSASSHLSQCCICTLSLHLEPSSPNLKFLFLGVFELRESP